MRDVWHCTPSEFNEQRAVDFFTALQIVNAEKYIEMMRARSRKR